MSRVALNRTIDIPNTRGRFGVYTLDSSSRLRFRIVDIWPRYCSGVSRLSIGGTDIDFHDFDFDRFYILEPGQTIGVVNLIQMEGRVLYLTGYLETDEDPCHPDNDLVNDDDEET